MTDDQELRKLAEAAKPYWGAVDMMVGGNPIAADIVMPFAQSISPDLYISLLDRLDAQAARIRELEEWQTMDTALRDGKRYLLGGVCFPKAWDLGCRAVSDQALRRERRQKACKGSITAA